MKFPIYVYTAVSAVSYTAPRGPHVPRPRRPVRLGIVSRLVKDVISVSPDALAPEHLWEPQAGMHVLFADDVVSVFGLADDEFAELPSALAREKEEKNYGWSGGKARMGGELTWSSVSVMVSRDTRAYPLRRRPLNRMYSHHLSQSLGSMSRIPLASPTYVL
jgi:hypothetical protein